MAFPFTENFDGVTAPALPSSFTVTVGSWVTDASIFTSSLNSLKTTSIDSGGTGVTPKGDWGVDTNSGNIVLSFKVRHSTIAGTFQQTGCYFRSSDNTGFANSYLVKLASGSGETKGLTLSKKLANADSGTPQVVGFTPTSTDWYTITITANGNSLSVQVQRSSDSNYLTSGGTWQAGQTNAINNYVDPASPITSAGHAGFWGYYGPGSAAGNYDDFSFQAFSTNATSFSLSGPSQIAYGVASSNYTVTPVGGTLAAGETVTLSDGGAGGTFSANPLTFALGASAGQTFTYTPATTGAITLTATPSPSLGSAPTASVTSYRVQISPSSQSVGNSVAASMTATLTGGAGSLTAATTGGTLSTTTPTSGTPFTLTTQSSGSGTDTVTVTGPGSSSATATVSYAPAPATGITITGPATVGIGAPATFTITANGSLATNHVVTLTHSDSGATITPNPITLSSGLLSTTFTLTAATQGAATISGTDAGGLPVTGASYTAQTAYATRCIFPSVPGQTPQFTVYYAGSGQSGTPFQARTSTGVLQLGSTPCYEAYFFGPANTDFSAVWDDGSGATTNNAIDVPTLAQGTATVSLGTHAPAGWLNVAAFDPTAWQLLKHRVDVTGTTTPATADTYIPAGFYGGYVYYQSVTLGTPIYLWNNAGTWTLSTTTPGTTGTAYFTRAGTSLSGNYPNQGTATGTPIVSVSGGSWLAKQQEATTVLSLTVTNGITANITGNLSGSVGSVTGGATATGQTSILAAIGSPMQAGATVTLDASQPNYAPAKAGDAMALTSGERTSTGTAVWASATRTLTGNVTVGGYASGQDPATLVLDVAASGHNNTGSIGAKINAAALAGDPLASAVPGSYTTGTAGKVLGQLADTFTSNTSSVFSGPALANAPGGAGSGTTAVTDLSGGTSRNPSNMTVQNNAAQPIQGATVTAYNAAAYAADPGTAAVLAVASTDAGGHWTLNIPTGEGAVTLVVAASGDAPQVVSSAFTV